MGPQNHPEYSRITDCQWENQWFEVPIFQKKQHMVFLELFARPAPPPIQLTRTISPNLPSQVSAELEDLKRLGRGQPVNPNIYGFL